MLHWSISLLAVPAVMILLPLSKKVRNGGATIARAVSYVLNCACARVSNGLDIVLQPSTYDGTTTRSRFALWILINTGAIIGLYELRTTHHDGMAVAAACMLAGLHVLLASSSILMIAEENRIMSVGQPRSGALFSPRAAIRNIVVIVLEVALVVASAAALLDMLSGAWPTHFLTRTPETGSSFADHLLCLLQAMPCIGWLVSTKDFAGDIAYGGPLGAMTQGIIYAIGSTLLLGAATAWILQRITISAILSKLEDADSDDAHYLQLILSRAPLHIKADLLALALDSGKPLAQLRAINVMRHLKVWTFPQTFLHHLEQFERKVKVAGLNQIREFLVTDGAAFEADLIVIGIQKAFGQYLARAPKVDNPVDDAILSRLGGIIACYASLVPAQRINFRTSREQYGVMLNVAKAHKEVEVRRMMTIALMALGPKGFLLNYLSNLHERTIGTVDVEIIERFTEYLRTKSGSLTSEDHVTLSKRLDWNLRHNKLPNEINGVLWGLHAALERKR